MSQLDETPSLMRADARYFPKGFCTGRARGCHGHLQTDYPPGKTDAPVVGSGAPGCAARNFKRRQQNVLIASAGLYMGTSSALFWFR